MAVNFPASPTTGQTYTYSNVVYTWDGKRWVRYSSATVPALSGNTGKYLTTDGTVVSWGTVNALPAQTSNSGKYLTTDGTSASWATLNAANITVADTAPGTPLNGNLWFNSANLNTYVYYNDGDSSQWVTIGVTSAANILPSQTGNTGRVLTTDGSTVSWTTFTGYTGSTGAGYTGSVGVGYTGSAGTNGVIGYNGSVGYTGSSGAAASTPAAVSNQQNTSTGAFGLPVGTTAQRPATAYNGYTRINTDTGYFEVYYNSTWNPLIGIGYLSATGGTITTDGNYKIHTFTSSGTFNVNSITPTSNSVDYLVVAGGGAGGGAGSANGGGGGAGGFRTGNTGVGAQSYSITVGAGGTGAGGNVRGANGSNSIFSTITSIGGGGGGTHDAPQSGIDGGSGGGGTQGGGAPGLGTAGQGNNGGGYVYAAGAGGGGAGGAGQTAPASSSAYNGSNWGGYPISAFINGGPGLASTITGTSVYYAGGGGGGQRDAYGVTPNGSGGVGGGGAGGTEAGLNGSSGTANTGGGGGGVGGNATQTKIGGSGGSGIVIIRYRYQ